MEGMSDNVLSSDVGGVGVEEVSGLDAWRLARKRSNGSPPPHLSFWSFASPLLAVYRIQYNEHTFTYVVYSNIHESQTGDCQNNQTRHQENQESSSDPKKQQLQETALYGENTHCYNQ